jgi:DNA-binding MarR family transcriptional regulator
MSSGPPSDTTVLRRFNRTFTQRVGVLQDSFLGLGLPLGSARLVYEIGLEPTTVRELRSRLDLDSGYLARQLRLLEERGLVEVASDPADRRRRLARLTRRGHGLWRRLEERSDPAARPADRPAARPAHRRAGHGGPPGPGRDRPPARGRRTLGRGRRGGQPVLRRAGPPVPPGV